MISGWIHPITGRIVADPRELERVIPASLLKAIEMKDKGDERHTGTHLTVTSSLTCPRKIALQRMLNNPVDPARVWSMTRGTWLHEQMGYAMGMLRGVDGQAVYYTEELAPEKCVHNGKLFGIPMSGKVDCLRKDFGELLDFKFRKPGAAKFLEDGVDGGLTASDSDSAQM